MKNVRVVTVLIALAVVLSLTFAVVPAYAEGVSSRSANRYQSPQGYTLENYSDGKNVICVSFQGFYFGKGINAIEVSADIYSDENFKIDFLINDDNSKLSASQLATKNKLITLADEIDAFIKQVDNAANAWYDGADDSAVSDVYQYNMAKQGTKLQITEHTYKMLQIAREMYVATNRAFNPAVYRLVDLWGFSSRIYSNGNFGLKYDREVTDEQFFSSGYPLPEQKYIEAFSQPAFTDFSNEAVTISNEDGKFYVTKNVAPAVVDGEKYEQWIDLGGIAKGYVVDCVKKMLTDNGITRYSVDAGTSSQAYGANYIGGEYTLGISDPFEPVALEKAILGVKTKNSSVSTSGQYVRKYTTNGVEYAHIIDGTKGKPAQTGVKLVTVIAPEGNSWAGKGDCLTTALTVMGRDRIIEFMNGYLKKEGVKIIVAYETIEGDKQILTNYDKSQIEKADTFDNYAWSVKNEDGAFEYDFDAKAPIDARNYDWLIITLAVIVGLAVIAVIVVHFVKRKGAKVKENVLNAKKDKPFKIGDIGAYMLVLLLVAVLFVAFLGGDNAKKDDSTNAVNIVKVVDFSKSKQGEVLFVYNVTRDEWVIYDDNSNNWVIEVTEDGNEVNVKFSRQINGEDHFNLMTITRGSDVSVKMTDSVCGRNQECVRNFGEITQSNGTIVCRPNRLKIVT